MKKILSPRYFRKPKNYLFQKYKENLLLISLSFFFFLFLIAGFISYEVNVYANSIPPIDEIKVKVTERGQNSFLYDRNGTLLYVFKDPHRDREYVEFDEIPSNIIWAAICAEDEVFFEHEGLDYPAIIRSALIYLKTKEKKVGGSTITQQLVKNTILSNEKTFDRKFREMLVTFFIEKEYTKEEILELYLNSTSFGGRIKGVKSAAKIYFDKELNDLNLDEAVFLISLIQRPGESSPLFSSNEQLAWDIVEQRRKYIFKQIKKNLPYIKSQNPKFYEFSEIVDAEEELISLNPNLGKIKAPHFVFYVKDILENEPYNISEEKLYNGGYHIYTSLDYSIQQIAEKGLQKGLRLKQSYRMHNGALVMLDVQKGDVLALVGSKDYWGQKDKYGRFDPHVNVTLSQRNLGSSIKPFLVYEAFKEDLYNPYSLISDSPININGYSPKNSDGTFMGLMSVTTALVKSRNTPFIRMIQKVSVSNFLGLLDSLGYKNANKNRDRYGLSIALGGFDSNLLEHTHAYSAFANKGNKPKIRPVLRIEDSFGDLKYESTPESNSVLEPEVVKKLNGILREYGPYQIAGKTGTTDSNKDTYFMGFNDKFVMGLWTGNNNNARMHPYAFGSTTAMPIWTLIYTDLIKEKPEFKSDWFKELPLYRQTIVTPQSTDSNISRPVSSPNNE